MKKKIAFAGPDITNSDIQEVMLAVEVGWYENYHLHKNLLEAKMCEYIGRKYALATHCCTQALHTSCEALDLIPGDEVICTDFSWIATGYSIKYTGALPVFVDVDPATWCIDPMRVEEAITPYTKAIMIVHSFGIPCDMDNIMDIAKQYNIPVIEDAAPSLGSEYKGRKTGSFGDLSCFSFQGGKIAVSGEGGILLTDNEELYKKSKLISSMGRTDSQCPFWSDSLGYQYTMGNLPAAMAYSQVSKIDKLVNMKRRIFSVYEERLKDDPRIKIVKERKGDRANYCYPSILVDGQDRDDIVNKLREEHNIHCRCAFPRMSRMTGKRHSKTPIAERVEKYGISLPSALNLTDEDIHFVCDKLLEVLK